MRAAKLLVEAVEHTSNHLERIQFLVDAAQALRRGRRRGQGDRALPPRARARSRARLRRHARRGSAMAPGPLGRARARARDADAQGRRGGRAARAPLAPGALGALGRAAGQGGAGLGARGRPGAVVAGGAARPRRHAARAPTTGPARCRRSSASSSITSTGSTPPDRAQAVLGSGVLRGQARRQGERPRVRGARARGRSGLSPGAAPAGRSVRRGSADAHRRQARAHRDRAAVGAGAPPRRDRRPVRQEPATTRSAPSAPGPRRSSSCPTITASCTRCSTPSSRIAPGRRRSRCSSSSSPPRRPTRCAPSTTTPPASSCATSSRTPRRRPRTCAPRSTTIPSSTEPRARSRRCAKALGEWNELGRLYRRRLKTLGPESPDNADNKNHERLRIWTELGELCLRALGEPQAAIAAFEAALSFDRDNLDRQKHLADLYIEAGPDAIDKAIDLHQAVLRREKSRVASYRALRALYAAKRERERAFACSYALHFLKKGDADDARAVAEIKERAFATARRPLDEQTWAIADAPRGGSAHRPPLRARRADHRRRPRADPQARRPQPQGRRRARRSALVRQGAAAT